MPSIPRDPSFDTSLALLREGYAFATNRCRRLDSDAFRTRLMLRPVVCMQGKEASATFYAPDRMTRNGALPTSVLVLLQDHGSVALLDGAAHRRRKAMFMAMMTPPSIARILDLFEQHWRKALLAPATPDAVQLLDASGRILCRAACAWAGAPLDGDLAEARADELLAMIENAGKIGPSNWRARRLRHRTEAWATRLVEDVRAERLAVDDHSPLAILAAHEDLDGQPLPATVAAVELLNLLRPIVAVSRYVAFAALALHQHPEQRPANDDAICAFVQEVRRFYPFFPAVGGRVRQPFAWRGHDFAEGDWLLLDIYGTNRDPRLWASPTQFLAERFLQRQIDAFELIPQGGGDFLEGHRCPGEGMTIALVERAVRLLVQAMRYDVPAQDLSVNLTRMPAQPESGFVIANLRALA